MKQTVSTTFIFQLVVVFTFLFSAFIALAITYNKVFKLKNETIAIIEKYEGYNNSYEIINNFLRNNGYKNQGHCEVGEVGVTDLDTHDYEKVIDNNKKYYYCINYYCPNSNSCNIINADEIYYKVNLFYKFNLPFLGDLFVFKIKGETSGINLWNETQIIK